MPINIQDEESRTCAAGWVIFVTLSCPLHNYMPRQVIQVSGYVPKIGYDFYVS